MSRRRRRPTRGGAPPTPGPPKPLSLGETRLLGAIWVGIALVLLTPLVMSPATTHPFVVSKAVWSRSLIGIVFALWATLALWQPRWRPPRSWLLRLLAASLAVSLLAAIFGVSPTRSLWSTYDRMQGVLDLAHWFAFTVVLAAMARESRGMIRVLNLHAAAALTVAVVALANFRGMEWPGLGLIPENFYPRIGGTLGNPTYLGAYLAVSALLAAGLLLRSPPAAPEVALPEAHQLPRARRRAALRALRVGGEASTKRASRWLARSFHGAAALFGLVGVGLSASVGAVAGLAVGVIFLLFLATRRQRNGVPAGAALVAMLRRPSGRGRPFRMTAVAAGAVVVVAAVPIVSGLFPSSTLAERLTLRTPAVEDSMRQRFASWEAGIKGFGDRPLLGYGPENYIVPFGLHASGRGATMQPHDHAHNILVEEAATEGLAGLLACLAVWGFALRTAWRAAHRSEGQSRAFAFSGGGAAIAACFVTMQALFFSASVSALFAVISTVVIHLEVVAFDARRQPASSGVLEALRSRRWVRVGGAAGAFLVAAAGLAVNLTIYSAATEIEQGRAERRFSRFERAADRFEPLANLPRRLLFENLARNWETLLHDRAHAARRLLARADAEAGRALAAEPRNWELHSSLARLYRTVASTDPTYADLAERHLEAALELAPNRNPP